MRMEPNAPSSFAAEATNMLREVRAMMHMWMAKKMAAEGIEYKPPKQYPCLVPWIMDNAKMNEQMLIFGNSVGAIRGCVESLTQELDAFHTKLTSLAAKAQEAKYASSADYDCWTCEEIAACRAALERKVCELSAQFAAVQMAVQAVSTGYCLIAICERPAYGTQASAPAAPPTSTKPPAA